MISSQDLICQHHVTTILSGTVARTFRVCLVHSTPSFGKSNISETENTHTHTQDKRGASDCVPRATQPAQSLVTSALLLLSFPRPPPLPSLVEGRNRRLTGGKKNPKTRIGNGRLSWLWQPGIETWAIIDMISFKLNLFELKFQISNMVFPNLAVLFIEGLNIPDNSPLDEHLKNCPHHRVLSNWKSLAG